MPGHYHDGDTRRKKGEPLHGALLQMAPAPLSEYQLEFTKLVDGLRQPLLEEAI